MFPSIDAAKKILYVFFFLISKITNFYIQDLQGNISFTDDPTNTVFLIDFYPTSNEKSKNSNKLALSEANLVQDWICDKVFISIEFSLYLVSYNKQ